MKPFDPRLLRFSRSSRGFILLTAVIAIANALLTITQAFLLADAIVRIFQRHLTITFTSHTVVGLVLVFVGRAVLNFFGDWASTIASTRIRVELREKLLRSALNSGSDFSHEGGSARLSILATSGINNLDGYFSKLLPQLFVAVFVPASVGLVVLLKDWRSGLICLFTVPLIPLFGIIIGRYTASATRAKLQALGIMGGYFLDLVNGLNTLKVFGRAKLQKRNIEELGNRYRVETMKVLRISFLSSLALELVATLSVALMAVSIGLRLVNGSISLAAGLVVLILAPEVYWPIRQVASYFHAASDGIAVFEELFELFEKPTPVRGVTVHTIESVAWKDLSVSFENREEIMLPDAEMKRGVVHNVVGVSGSGKSTLARILLGLQEPSTGSVTITTDSGEYKLHEIALDAWRNLVSWMPQEPIFPVGTIRDALRQSAPLASDDELVAALATAALSVTDLIDGLETQLGTSKAALSIGQIRKIALARAILKPAPLLILDEPSASVDDLSEMQIQTLINSEASKGRFILLISHRKLDSVPKESISYVGVEV